MQWTQFEHQRIDVEIKWTTPKTFEEIQEMEEEKCQNTYFYKIVGRYNDKFKLFYIGKCVQQYVTTRIFQKDHIVKQVLFKEAHKRHTFMVCLGNLTDEQKHKPKEIGNAESLLIYSHTHSDFSYIKNKQCSVSHKVIKNYRIINKGWRKEGMYRTIAYGLFVKN